MSNLSPSLDDTFVTDVKCGSTVTHVLYCDTPGFRHFLTMHGTRAMTEPHVCSCVTAHTLICMTVSMTLFHSLLTTCPCFVNLSFPQCTALIRWQQATGVFEVTLPKDMHDGLYFLLCAICPYDSRSIGHLDYLLLFLRLWFMNGHFLSAAWLQLARPSAPTPLVMDTFNEWFKYKYVSTTWQIQLSYPAISTP